MNAADLTVVLPAYLEESSIHESVTRLIKCLDQNLITFQIRVVIDGPGDHTAEIVRRISDPRVSVIELERNFGKGRAIREGLRDCSTDFVGYMDADLDLHPNGLVEAFAALKNSPTSICGAIGSKLHPGSQVEYPLSRRLLSKIYKLLVRVSFSLDLDDTQTGLKVFRREPIDELLPLLGRNGFEFDLELLTLLARSGNRFVEVPVALDYRFGSTVNLKSGTRTLLDTIGLALQMRRTDRPSRRSD